MYNIALELLVKANQQSITGTADQIKRGLGSVTVDVDLKLNPGAVARIKELNAETTRLGTSLQQLRSSTADAVSSVDRVAQAVGRLASQSQAAATAARPVAAVTREVGTAARASAGEFTEFGAQVGLAARRFSAFTVAAGSFFAVTRALRAGITEAVAFDLTLNKLRQVSGDTAAKVAEVGNEVTRLSVSLGTSSADLAEAALTLRQAGLSLNDTKKALEGIALASLAPNFSDVKQITEGVVASFQQFGKSADNIKNQLGAINAVAGDFAAEASDLVTAIQKAGGVASQTGAQFNELLAVFTSIRSTTRESADAIATGLRTIFTRVQRQETVDSLKQLGINLRYTSQEAKALGDSGLEDQFVGAYEAVRRLSEGLSKLRTTDPRFAAAVEELGGYRQVSRVIPLIQQFTEAQRALNVARLGSASLESNAATRQEALATQLTKVREEFQKLVNTVVQSQGFQALVKSGTEMLSLFIKIADVVKPLVPLLGAVFGAKLAFGGASAVLSGVAAGVAGRSRPAAVAPPTGPLGITRRLGFASGGQVPRIVGGLADTTDYAPKVGTGLRPSAFARLYDAAEANAGVTPAGPVAGASRPRRANDTYVQAVELLTRPKRYASGDRVSGGTPGRDSVPAMLMPDEFVIKADSAKRIGYGALRHMNDKGELPRGYAAGGLVRGYAKGDRVEPLSPAVQAVLDRIGTFVPGRLKSSDPDKIQDARSDAVLKVLAAAKSKEFLALSADKQEQFLLEKANLGFAAATQKQYRDAVKSSGAPADLGGLGAKSLGRFSGGDRESYEEYLRTRLRGSVGTDNERALSGATEANRIRSSSAGRGKLSIPDEVRSLIVQYMKERKGRGEPQTGVSDLIPRGKSGKVRSPEGREGLIKLFGEAGLENLVGEEKLERFYKRFKPTPEELAVIRGGSPAVKTPPAPGGESGLTTGQITSRLLSFISKQSGVDLSRVVGSVTGVSDDTLRERAAQSGHKLPSGTSVLGAVGSLDAGRAPVYYNSDKIQTVGQLLRNLSHETGHAVDKVVGGGRNASDDPNSPFHSVGRAAAEARRAEDLAAGRVYDGKYADYRYSPREGFANAFRELVLTGQDRFGTRNAIGLSGIGETANVPYSAAEKTSSGPPTYAAAVGGRPPSPPIAPPASPAPSGPDPRKRFVSLAQQQEEERRRFLRLYGKAVISGRPDDPLAGRTPGSYAGGGFSPYRPTVPSTPVVRVNREAYEQDLYQRQQLDRARAKFGPAFGVPNDEVRAPGYPNFVGPSAPLNAADPRLPVGPTIDPRLLAARLAEQKRREQSRQFVDPLITAKRIRDDVAQRTPLVGPPDPRAIPFVSRVNQSGEAPSPAVPFVGSPQITRPDVTIAGQRLGQPLLSPQPTGTLARDQLALIESTGDQRSSRRQRLDAGLLRTTPKVLASRLAADDFEARGGASLLSDKTKGQILQKRLNQVNETLLRSVEGQIRTIDRGISSGEAYQKALERVGRIAEGKDRVARDRSGAVVGSAELAGKLLASGGAPGGKGPTSGTGRFLGRARDFAGSNGGLIGLAGVAGLVSQELAPSEGTVRAAAVTGNEGRARTQSAASSGLLYGSLAAGVAYGAGAGAPGIVAGAVVGGVAGIVLGLREAEKSIREAKVGAALDKFSELVANAAGGLNGTSAVSLEALNKEISTVRSGVESRVRKETSGFFGEASAADTANVRQRELRASFGGQASQVIGLLSRRADEAVRRAPAAEIQDDKGVKAVADRFVKDPVVEALSRVVADVRGIPVAQVLREFTESIEASARQLRAQREIEGGRRAAESTGVSLARLVEVFDGAAAAAERINGEFEARANQGGSLPVLGQAARPGTAGFATDFAPLRDAVGGRAPDFLAAGSAADRVSTIIPEVLQTVARSGLTGDGAAGKQFNDLLKAQLLPGVAADKRDEALRANPALERVVLATQGRFTEAERSREKDGGIGRVLQEDPLKLARELQEAAGGAFARVSEELNRSISSLSSGYVGGLGTARQARRTARDSEGDFDRVLLESQRIEASVAADRTGFSAGSFLSLGDLSRPFEARQSGLAGRIGFDPEAISARLAVLQNELGSARTARDDARGDRVRFPELAKKFDDLQDESERLKKALQGLSDVSTRVAAAQEKLAEANANRDSRLSYGEAFLSGNAKERARLVQGRRLAEAVDQGVVRPDQLGTRRFQQLQQFQQRFPGLVLNSGRAAGESYRVRLGEVPGVLNKDQEAERRGLQDKAASEAFEALRAARELSDSQKNEADSLFKSLDEGFARLFDNLNQRFGAGQVQQAGADLTREEAKLADIKKKIETRGLVQRLGATDDAGIDRLRESIPDLEDFRSRSKTILELQDPERIRKQVDGARGEFAGLGYENKPIGFEAIEKDIGTRLAKYTDDLGGPLQEDTSRNVYKRYRSYFSEENGFSGTKNTLPDIVQEEITKARFQRAAGLGVERKAVADKLAGKNINASELSRLSDGDCTRFKTALEEKTLSFGGLDEKLKEAQASVARFTSALELANRNLAALGGRGTADAAVGGGLAAAVVQARAAGGPIFKPMGTDTVPAMLTPGEYVVKKEEARAHLPLLQKINAGKLRGYASGGTVISPYTNYTGGDRPGGRNVSVDAASAAQFEAISEDSSYPKSLRDYAARQAANLRGYDIDPETGQVGRLGRGYMKLPTRPSAPPKPSGPSTRQLSQALRASAIYQARSAAFGGNLRRGAFGLPGEEGLVEANVAAVTAKRVGDTNRADERLGKYLQRPRFYADGGPVGSGTDTVPAMLTPGEFVFSRPAVQAIGASNLQRAHRFAAGGLVPGGQSDAGGVRDNGELVRALTGFGQQAAVLATALSSFNAGAEKLAGFLEKFPSSIEMTAKFSGEVIVNGNIGGANDLTDAQKQKLNDLVMDMVEERLRQQFPEMLQPVRSRG